ncbi:MAG: amino acid amidase [bacterium]|nr:amino acid amidase [bacterium]
MKVYISADIEGVCGITDWSEASRESEAYPEFRERMTEEVIAACEGAIAAGATEILVKDAHASGRNVFAEHLPREARMVRGWSGHPYCMVQELDATFDAVLFVGWHSAAGRGGNPLAHTLSSKTIASIRVNGTLASEFLLHTFAAALDKVPVAFVSGDEQLCADVRQFDERIETVAVLRGEGASTVALHPGNAQAAIREGVQRALTGELLSFQSLPERFAVEIQYIDQRRAYRSSFYPGASLETPTSVVFESEDWFEVLRLLQFVA